MDVLLNHSGPGDFWEEFQSADTREIFVSLLLRSPGGSEANLELWHAFEKEHRIHFYGAVFERSTDWDGTWSEEDKFATAVGARTLRGAERLVANRASKIMNLEAWMLGLETRDWIDVIVREVPHPISGSEVADLPKARGADLTDEWVQFSKALGASTMWRGEAMDAWQRTEDRSEIEIP